MFKLSLQECMSCGRRRTRTVVIVEVGLVVWMILKKVVVLPQEKDAEGCIEEGGLSDLVDIEEGGCRWFFTVE